MSLEKKTERRLKYKTSPSLAASVVIVNIALEPA